MIEAMPSAVMSEADRGCTASIRFADGSVKSMSLPHVPCEGYAMVDGRRLRFLVLRLNGTLRMGFGAV